MACSPEASGPEMPHPKPTGEDAAKPATPPAKAPIPDRTRTNTAPENKPYSGAALPSAPGPSPLRLHRPGGAPPPTPEVSPDPRLPSAATTMATTTTTTTPPPTPPSAQTVLLPPWDQTALRSYMRVVLCFPMADGRRGRAARHLRAALDRLGRQRPDFAGSLRVGSRDGVDGCVFLRTAPGDAIPFEEVDLSLEDGVTGYEALKKADFPPGAFVHARFAMPCAMDGDSGVPVATVKAFWVRGGLLLAVFFHHALADGECLRMLLESLAAQTRGAPIEYPAELFPSGLSPQQQQPPQHLPLDSPALHALLALAPEYALLPTPSGPTTPRPLPGGIPADHIPKTGRTFVFTHAALAALGARLHALSAGPAPPSHYTCLAALTWAHATRARLADTAFLPPPAAAGDAPARLQTMVNWKRRVGAARGAAGYFGNATAVAVTQRATGEVAAAGAGDVGVLAGLAGAVATTIAGVDDGFVEARERLFAALPDPRRLGLDFDPRSPQDLGFNTWRHFGADTAWAVPGLGGEAAREEGGDGGCVPDAIRRVQDVWNMSGALILPAKRDSLVHELLVTLPASAMELLCADEGWMRWVDRVVG